MNSAQYVINAVEGLQALISQLRSDGYRTVGPRLQDGTILYDEIDGVESLPVGWTDKQDGGHYRLDRTEDEAFFRYAVGPHSFKKFLHVPHQELWHAERRDGELDIRPVSTAPVKYAFIAIRSCEIHAIEIQDRVLLEDAHIDLHYAARRKDNFILAVNCAHAGGTCFCTSMNTGPKATRGFDLALTELIDRERHMFLVESGSEKGAELLARIPARPATVEDRRRADAVIEKTSDEMGRRINTDNLHDLLLDNLEHPRWDDVAERCLSCGNCTLVCPTCFCTRETDMSDLTGNQAGRAREWDSCFTLDFSYLHGGSVRQSTKSRYRQWMTHKLATWIDQFGTSGCVGCGRCITWCPVGIDITEEVRAIEGSEEGHDG